MDHLVAPSLLSADFGKLAEEIAMLNQSQADWFHIDIMDGNFVPNISFGFPVLNAIQKHAKKPLDFHLMINNPDHYIQSFRDSGASVITVHYEACAHLHRTIQVIKNSGAKAGVAINPHTPVGFLMDIITEVDLILIMSVNPGFGGQKFIEHSLKKISLVKEMISMKNINKLIEVDGGIDLQNAKQILNAGANVLVAGSSVFSAKNPASAIHEIKHM